MSPTYLTCSRAYVRHIQNESQICNQTNVNTMSSLSTAKPQYIEVVQQHTSFQLI